VTGKRDWTPAELQAFEREIADLFLAKRIHGPIHLAGSVDGTLERSLIDIFAQVKAGDWVCSTHRNHLHALLAGIPRDWLRDEILAGRSMHINSPERCFLTSAIVGGICPIAVGLALALKRKDEARRVWCFVGDMGAETGAFHEAVKYAHNFDLPVSFVIEDNGMSTDTPTREAWGLPLLKEVAYPRIVEAWMHGAVHRCHYTRAWPHTGVGQWVNF